MNALASSKNPPHGQPGHRCGTPVGAPLIASNILNKYLQIPDRKPAFDQTPAPKGTYQNPAHGQPGHRCDVPVGSLITAADSLGATAMRLNPKHGEPGHRCDVAVGQALPPDNALQPINSTIAKPTLNPKHGEPGHRCDIAVGQPLDGAPPPASTAARSTTNPTSPKPSAASSANANKLPLLNPRHGEPGHRCDIAVGQPLRNADSTTASVQNMALPVSPDTSTLIKPLLNPAHGQPFHDCSIAVGKPLKQ